MRTSVTRLGPLRLVTFAGGRGFVTYPRLDGVDAPTLRGWVAQALEHYAADARSTGSSGRPAGTTTRPAPRRARRPRFEPQEPESIMVGETRLLAVDVRCPPVCRAVVTDEADVRAMCVMQDEAFGDAVSERIAEALLRRLELRDGMELWVAEAEGEMVAAGRLEPVAGTRFAGIWGGDTLPRWRGRGIYRALTAVRARSALDRRLHRSSTATPRSTHGRSWSARAWWPCRPPRRTTGVSRTRAESWPASTAVSGRGGTPPSTGWWPSNWWPSAGWSSRPGARARARRGGGPPRARPGSASGCCRRTSPRDSRARSCSSRPPGAATPLASVPAARARTPRRGRAR